MYNIMSLNNKTISLEKKSKMILHQKYRIEIFYSILDKGDQQMKID